MKLVLDSTKRISTKDIYQILIRNEFNLNADFKLRIESVYDGFSLPSILEFTHSKFIPVSVRSHMWRIIHKIEYSEIEEAKVKLSSPLCKQCGELDITRIHLYFECERVRDNGIIFIRVLRIFDSQYTLEEVLDFKGIEGHPQTNWFIALTLFFIDKNRKRCSVELYKAYMWSELETLRRSKRADEQFLISATIILELLE